MHATLVASERRGTNSRILSPHSHAMCPTVVCIGGIAAAVLVFDIARSTHRNHNNNLACTVPKTWPRPITHPHRVGVGVCESVCVFVVWLIRYGHTHTHTKCRVICATEFPAVLGALSDTAGDNAEMSTSQCTNCAANRSKCSRASHRARIRGANTRNHNRSTGKRRPNDAAG